MGGGLRKPALKNHLLHINLSNSSKRSQVDHWENWFSTQNSLNCDHFKISLCFIPMGKRNAIPQYIGPPPYAANDPKWVWECDLRPSLLGVCMLQAHPCLLHKYQQPVRLRPGNASSFTSQCFVFSWRQQYGRRHSEWHAIFFFLHWQRKEETFPVTTHPLNLLNICYLP